jgi:ABC-2 type transport system permease protein
MNRLKEILKNPKLKYGGFASIITFAVVVAALVINLLFQQLGWQIDMTKGDVFTLGQQSHEILDELEDPVTIYVLARRNDTDPMIMEALDRYRQASSLVSIEVVDADTNPGFVSRYDPNGEGLGNGSVIVATDRSYRVISAIDLYALNTSSTSARVMGINVERRVTNALIYVATGRTPVIYVTTGRNEADISLIGDLADDLESENYEVRSLNLLQAPQIPDDTAVLLMFGPRSDLSEGEAQKVREYLDGGGAAMFMVDILAQPLPIFNEMLSAYGMALGDGVIIEQDSNHRTSNPFQLFPIYEDHEIVQPLLEAQEPTLFPYARPVEILATRPREVDITPLFATSDDAFARIDLNQESMTPIEGDALGPFPLALAAVATDLIANEEVYRIVLVGNARFMLPITPYGYLQGNRDFFLNSLGWLQNQGQSVTIRPKSTFQFPMQMTGTQVLIIAGVLVLVIPLGVFVAGLVVWLRRRHL